jgi:DNA polymerase elongation subunit (family B)
MSFSDERCLPETSEDKLDAADDDELDSMIVWTGVVDDTVYYRLLGSCSNDNLHMLPVPEVTDYKHVVSHNEGTNYKDFSTPCIGSGTTKTARDAAIRGYTLGVNLTDHRLPPPLIERSKHHILAYDIECEYLGPQFPSFNSPIMCALLVCSCGYKVFVTRSLIPDVVARRCVSRQIYVTSNEELAETCMSVIEDHRPLFSIGHNVYDFDNVKIACALPSESRFRDFFIPTSYSSSKGVYSLGLIMCIPGVNNLDTLRYIRKAIVEKPGNLNFSNTPLQAGFKSKPVPK